MPWYRRVALRVAARRDRGQFGRTITACRRPRTYVFGRFGHGKYGTVPEFRGREVLRQFFLARSARQKGYRLRKQFRGLMNDVITNVWDGEWEDAGTGRRMKGFGVEVWMMRDGKIAIWEASFNTGPVDQPVDVAKMLG